ncbi:MAG: PAS domain-containing protein, partial [Acidobacteriota bacterium]|nr:PAS domain-containing protein [Acidobacteriota bacterium]
VTATDAEPRLFPKHHPEAADYLIAPITSPVSVYGWICLVCNDGRAFTVEEERQVLAMAGHIGRIFELEHEVAERLEAEAALEQSERLNRNLVEHLPHRILVKDRNSVIVFCNANYANDVGLRVDEVIGKDAFALHAPELAEAYQANDRQVIESGALQDLEEPYARDGQERWVHTVKVPYRDAQGVITGVLVVFEDVTERRQFEQQSQQAQKMEAVGELAGGVAHDFNNLLTAILGYCELIAENLAADDPNRNDIGEIQKAGLRAADLTRQLLAFSRKEIIAPTTLDLNAIVSDMRPMLDRLIREDVRILVRLGQHLAPVTADRGQIEQIVMNLAVNARDAMPTGGTLTIETANVEVDAKTAQQHGPLAPGPHVSLTITDTGSGMTPGVKARIFELFFTTKPRGRGTGLGLASVQGTIARSGGSISVLSEVGKGSSFQVLLPKADATVVAQVTAPVVSTLTGTETVLVVEDADELRSLISLLLRRQGYTVLMAANADEARQQFAAHASIDLVLTDVVMPGASGPELGRALQASRPALKVIYMSGYAQDAIVQHGVLLPGIAFLPKPFTAETLGRKIRSVLDSPTLTGSTVTSA